MAVYWTDTVCRPSVTRLDSTQEIKHTVITGAAIVGSARYESGTPLIALQIVFSLIP